MRFSRAVFFAVLADVAASQLVVSTDFKRVSFPPDLVQITRRDTFDVTAINNLTGGGYYSEVEVGTPGQKMLMHLDTGSSDTWVVDKQADLCNSPRLQRTYGTGCTSTFDTTKSSTYELVTRNGFDITYLDARNIQGDYISDTVNINGKKVSSQQLGLAIQTVKGSGLMGLGFSTGVSTRRSYPTILDNMVSQKLIGRKAFSLWLNDLSSSEGTLLFGGIDTEKYIGSLTTLPLVDDYHSERITSYSVAMTGVSLETPDGKMTELAAENFNASTVLDSGSTVCLLPDRIANQIWEKYDVIDAGYGFVDCKWRGPDGENHFLDFEFSGVTIRVPLEEMVLDNLDPIMDQLEGLLPFDNPCMFGIQSNSAFDINSSRFALLGDTFLRSARDRFANGHWRGQSSINFSPDTDSQWKYGRERRRRKGIGLGRDINFGHAYTERNRECCFAARHGTFGVRWNHCGSTYIRIRHSWRGASSSLSENANNLISISNRLTRVPYLLHLSLVK
ncbi:putative aspartic-type endopeptidase OPSB [Colletotrichum fructicola Nara gc5]|uniref:Putative aspartic-type endopeptidase OPSB n=1 Tax=Colletotrichum fructicola (strain Nara gc5) TaxID=1213859 RepID=A0A7J6IW64_COLFN|nr:putative aspartic-type endopeptidase OPSB [Colletotrichum fructicola Nara gc5]